MRYPASEKAEIIQLVERSHLPAKHTLDKLGIPRATFYRWHERYREGGPEELATIGHDPIASGTAFLMLSIGDLSSTISIQECPLVTYPSGPGRKADSFATFRSFSSPKSSPETRRAQRPENEGRFSTP